LPAISRRWASAVARSVLVSGDGHAELEAGTDPAFLIGDRLADALVNRLRTADRSRPRECPLPGGGCGRLFLDRATARHSKAAGPAPVASVELPGR
jgi:predicted RNA-binding Zn ribbon-like protein